MNSLRAKLATLLVAAVLVVVGLATWITFLMIERPGMEQINNPMAGQIRLILELAGKLGSQPDGGVRMPGATGSPFGFRPTPAAGDRFEPPTVDLRLALERQGLPFPAVVTRTRERGGGAIASVKISDAEWLVLPFAMPPPPPTRWPVLGGWLLLIAAGTTAVAVIAVYRVTQPLALVQRAVAHIGPSGELPKLPETGPAEVRATAHAINVLSSRLKSAMESRMRLVAAAGHDLRTPMTRMRLRAEFLDEEDREKWLKDLDELDRIADSAIRLVREETDAASEGIVCLDIMVGEVVAELQEMRLDARLAHSEPASVRATPLSLRRGLRNLIINAATHGKGAVVSVRADGEAAIVVIEDCGPGIPEALLGRAVEPFFRVDPARKALVPGAGLGLAIAKEIILRNRGQLTLTNRQAGGLLQQIELPLVAPTPASPHLA